jgi:RHS repeat-associated protein
VVGVDTQFHTWDGWRQVVQYSLDTAPSPDAAVPTKQFVWGSELDELLSYRRKNGSTWENYFVLHGGQDTAAKLVNSSGAVVEQYEYDPYGKVSVYVGSSTTAVATSSVGLPFLWKGVRLDSETGLLQMRNRYYATSLGRFLTIDPLGCWGDEGNMGNAYAYCGNEPIEGVDSTGLKREYTSVVCVEIHRTPINPDCELLVFRDYEVCTWHCDCPPGQGWIFGGWQRHQRVGICAEKETVCGGTCYRDRPNKGRAKPRPKPKTPPRGSGGGGGSFLFIMLPNIMWHLEPPGIGQSGPQIA